MKFRSPLTVALGAIAFAACSPEPATTDGAAMTDHGAMEGHDNMPAADTAPAGGLPASIVAERGGFIPEGVEYDQANRRLLTGSLSEGTIFEIGADGSVTPFITDSALVSSVGIEADEPHDRLLVANSDRAVFGGQGAGQAKLGVYSLTTGERLAMVDLGALLPAGSPYFANDVAVDDAGNAYVTDTQRNVLYRVSVNFEPSVFYAFPATEGLSLNGIVYHPDGYLLVADSGNGTIYKTPIDAPAGTSMVRLAEPVTGDDGLVWRADGALAVIQNISPGGRVTALTSNDGWASAQVAAVAPHEGQATTGAAVGDDIYTVQPHFNDQDPPTFHRAVFQ